MPRTKRRFEDDDPSSSSSEEGDDSYNRAVSSTTTFTRSTYSGGGKQLSRMMGRPGGGKQMRFTPEDDGDSDEGDDDDEEEDEEEDDEEEESDDEENEESGGGFQKAHTVVMHRGAPGGGKVLRPPMGGGKQLGKQIQRREEEDENNEDDSEDGDSEEESEEEESEEDQPIYVGGGRGGGKSISRMQERLNEDKNQDGGGYDSQPIYGGGGRGGGKSISIMQSRLNEDRNEDDDDGDGSSGEDEESSDEEESPKPIVITQPSGGGKRLPPSTNSASSSFPELPEAKSEEISSGQISQEDSHPQKIKDNDDMDIENESEEENTLQTRQPSGVTQDDMEESEDTSSEDEDENEDEDMEESEDGNDGDEGSSDDESEGEQELDALDEQSLIKGDDDKKYLDSLPEIERESILAQRFEERKAAEDMRIALMENKRKEREKKELKEKSKKPQKKNVKKKPAKPKKKEDKPPPPPEVLSDDEGKEEAQDEPDTSRDLQLAQELALNRAAKSQDPVQAKRQAALEELRKARVAADAAKNKDEDSESDYGSEDSADEEFKPWLKKKTDRKEAVKDRIVEDDDDYDVEDSTAHKKYAEADLEDFRNVTIPRRRLQRWCNEPYFEKAVMNFFVRLAIGRDSRTQKACYRVCKIVKIERKTEYQFPSTPGTPIKKPVKTNKWLHLKFADSTRAFKMVVISDSRPTQEDVTQYMTQLKNRRNEVPSKKEAMKMKKNQDDLVSNYTYTQEDIDKTIAEKKNFSKTISNIGAEKTRVNIALQASMTALAEAERNLEKLEGELNEVDDQSELTRDIELARDTVAEAKEDLQKRKKEQEKVLKAETNRKNRMKESKKVQDWVKVNQKAKAANKFADVQAYKVELERQKKNEIEGKTFDPFARRNVRSRILWEVGQEPNEEEKKKAEEVRQVNRKEATKGTRRSDINEGGNSNKENNNEKQIEHKDDLANQIYGLAIDEELLTRSSRTNDAFGLKHSSNRVRKGISLQDYLERRKVGTL